MEKWLKISVLLCVFGFLKKFQPSEPFLAEYLLGDWNGRNITEEELNRDVYPVAGYSYLAHLIIVFLLTDFLRYKPLIVVLGMTGVVVWGMLLWTSSKMSLLIMQCLYGTYMATEVAYFTYIYAKVDKIYFSRVSAHTQVAILMGKLIGGIASQLLIVYEIMDYKELHYLTFIAQIAATIWALFLPAVETSMYFNKYEEKFYVNHKSTESVESRALTHTEQSLESRLKGLPLVYKHFKSAYTNRKVIQWSILYAVCFCGRYQIYTYIQILWKAIEPNPDVVWNAGVDAALAFIGAIFAFMAGFIDTGKITSSASLLLISILCILEGGAVLLSVLPQNLYASYAGFIIFGSLCAFAITIAGAQVARFLEEDSFGLVFGFNTFMALIFQALVNILFVNGTVISLDIEQQFIFFAFTFIVVGVLYTAIAILDYINSNRISSSSEISESYLKQKHQN